MFSPALEQLTTDPQLSGEKVATDTKSRSIKMLWSLPGRARLLSALEGAGGITDEIWTVILHQLGLSGMRTEGIGPPCPVPSSCGGEMSPVLQVTSAIVWVLCLSLSHCLPIFSTILSVKKLRLPTWFSSPCISFSGSPCCPLLPASSFPRCYIRTVPFPLCLIHCSFSRTQLDQVNLFICPEQVVLQLSHFLPKSRGEEVCSPGQERSPHKIIKREM